MPTLHRMVQFLVRQCTMIPVTLFLSLIKYGELLLGGDIRTSGLVGVRIDVALASLVGWALGSIAFLERHLMGAKV